MFTVVVVCIAYAHI